MNVARDKHTHVTTAVVKCVIAVTNLPAIINVSSATHGMNSAAPAANVVHRLIIAPLNVKAASCKTTQAAPSANVIPTRSIFENETTRLYTIEAMSPVTCVLQGASTSGTTSELNERADGTGAPASIVTILA